MKNSAPGKTTKNDLVLIHGWGFNSRIWQQLVPYIQDQWRIKLVDLPGYVSPNIKLLAANKQINADQMIDIIEREVPQYASVLAWSLGGLLAMKLAAVRTDIKSLLLIASSPCFLNKPGWQHGIDPVEFDQLEHRLHSSKTKTLKKFAGLVAVGEGQAKSTVNKLNKYISDAKECRPAVETLQSGLTILKTEDLRNSLQSQRCPMAMIFGANDTLVKHTTAQAVKTIRPDIETIEIAGTGHAPFFTRPQETAAALMTIAGKLF